MCVSSVWHVRRTYHVSEAVVGAGVPGEELDGLVTRPRAVRQTKVKGADADAPIRARSQHAEHRQQVLALVDAEARHATLT